MTKSLKKFVKQSFEVVTRPLIRYLMRHVCFAQRMLKDLKRKRVSAKFLSCLLTENLKSNQSFECVR